MPQVKRKTPEQFVAQSPIGERLSGGVFERNLASGALRLIKINDQPQEHPKLGNNEAKISEVLKSGYFGITNENPEFIEAEINDLLITEADVPQSYYDLQKRIARERGYGDMEITDELEEKIKTLQNDQAESLMKWSEYLRSDGNGHIYPDWFKVYVWESLKKMGEFDREKGKFKKRTKSTTAPWPELNAEALAYVWGKINHGVVKGDAVDDEKLANLLNNGNFSTLYAHALHEAEAGGITPELREITEGRWVKYDQTQSSDYSDSYEEDGEYTDDAFVDADNDTAMSLSQSLYGKRTGWCTAHGGTAADQLRKGDFYVYYTLDDQGNYTIPRIAIRMEWGVVAEVRGIESGQNLESNMIDIVVEKLKTLPGGDEYFEKVENMKRLTEIDERVKGGGELTADDIIFLRFSGEIKGFGHYEDPRIEESLQGRSLDDDLDLVLDDPSVTANDINEIVKHLHSEEIVKNVDKLFSAGVSVVKLADNIICHEGTIYRAAMDKLVQKGVNSEYLYGLVDVMWAVIDAWTRGYDWRRCHVERWTDGLENTVNNLSCDDEMKNMIARDIISYEMPTLDGYEIYGKDLIKKLVDLGGDRAEISRRVLQSMPDWEIDIFGVDGLVQQGIDEEEVKKYVASMPGYDE